MDAKRPLPEKTYLFNPGQNGTDQKAHKDNGNGATEVTGAKRSATPIKEEFVESNKVQKDAQKTNFKSLNVPVDEKFFEEVGNPAG